MQCKHKLFALCCSTMELSTQPFWTAPGQFQSLMYCMCYYLCCCTMQWSTQPFWTVPGQFQSLMYCMCYYLCYCTMQWSTQPFWTVPGQFQCLMYVQYMHVVHLESFRSNAQNANAFARRNCQRVERNDEFSCVYLCSFACVRLRSFASTVRDRPRARMCVRTRAHTYIGKVWAWHYLR